LALLLDRGICFERSRTEGTHLSVGDRALELPPFDPAAARTVRPFEDRGEHFAVLSERELTTESAESGRTTFSVDVVSAALRAATLFEEEGVLRRASDGTISSFVLPRGTDDRLGYHHDLLLDAVRLLSRHLDIPFSPMHPGGAPFSLILTFDIDGSHDGARDIAALTQLLRDHRCVEPTLMVLAQTGEEKTPYDPIYDIDAPWMRTLYEGNYEFGLHSSFAAHEDVEMLRSQKHRVEQACGRTVLAHRAHYLRSSYPRSFGKLLLAGFRYDCTLGFYDLAGHRNGTGLPVRYADPGGSMPGIWGLSLTVLDQHLFATPPAAEMSWITPAGKADAAGRARLFGLIERAARNGGALTVDWHLHSFDPAFPHHQPALSAILGRAAELGAWVGGVGAFLAAYEARWQSLFSEDETIRVREGQVLVNVVEQRHYKAGATEAVTHVAEYVDASAASLRAILPVEAESIVDVGCGHGWVSQRIPPFHRVVCVDTSMEIMRDVVRPKVCGSILDLPLGEGSVDMTMATDVIEHLTPEERRQAAAELDRVTRDYVYLQTPHNEALEISTIRCRSCAHEWHLNFHKDCFTAEKLANEMGPAWRPAAIVFTGPPALFDPSPKEIVDRRRSGTIPLGVVGSYACPRCGATSSFSAAELHPPYAASENIAVASRAKPTLQYSEVGALFVREGKPAPDWGLSSDPVVIGRSGKRKPLPSPMVFDSSTLLFDKPCLVAETSANTLLPYILCANCVLEPCEDGAHVVAAPGEAHAELLVGFPRPQGARLFALDCAARGAAEICVTAEGYDNRIVHEAVRKLSDGPTTVKVSVEDTDPIALWRLRIAGDVVLVRAAIDAPSYLLRRYDIGASWHLSHVAMLDGETAYFWSIPASGMLVADKRLQSLPKHILDPPCTPMASGTNLILAEAFAPEFSAASAVTIPDASAEPSAPPPAAPETSEAENSPPQRRSRVPMPAPLRAVLHRVLRSLRARTGTSC
jgi:hypothetical protein